MIRLFVFIGSLLVLALIAALAVPPFVNWNEYRVQFETEASRIVGQPVKVLGQTSARLLPLPSVTFENVQIGETANGKSMLTAASFHMDMELAPLLKGDVVVVDMELVEPKIDVLIDGQGKVDWNVSGGGSGVDFSAEDISIDNIKISNGLLRVRDERFDREFILKDINANASARTVAGPWKVLGRISYLDSVYKIDASSGRWQRSENGDGRVRLKLGIAPKSLPYDVLFDGPFLLQKGEPTLSGKFQIKPMARQTSKDRIDFPRPPRSQAVKARLNGVVQLSPIEALVPQFELKIGNRSDPYTIDGSVVTRFGERATYEVRAEGQQINLARFSNRSNAETIRANNTSLLARIETVRQLLEDIPKFDSNGKLFLDLPAVITGDTVIRNVELEATPLAKGAGWQIDNFKAQLPGRTEVRANGRLGLGEKFGYEGALVIASRQPSGLAKWLGQGDVPALLNLPSAGMSATAKMTAKSIQLDNMEIALGTNQLLGRFERQAATGDDKARIETQLQGDNVDLDQLSALFNLLSGNKGAAAKHDISLKLEAGKAKLGGVEVEKINVEMTLTNDQISVQSLSIGSLAGAGLNVSGSLSGFPNKLDGHINGNLSSANPVRLLKLVQSTWGPLPLLGHFIENPETITDTDLAFDVKAGGKLDKDVAISLGGFSGGSSLKANILAKVDNTNSATLFDDRHITLNLLVDNPQSSQLLTQLGVPVLPLDGAGTARLQLKAIGRLNESMAVDATLTAADVAVSAKGDVGLKSVLGDAVWLGDLSVEAKSDDLDPIIMLSGLPIPGFGLGAGGNFIADLKLDDGKISASGIRATIGDNQISGSLVLNRANKPRQYLTGDLQINEIEAGLIPKLVFSVAPDDGAEEVKVIPNQLLAGLDGKITLNVDRLFIGEGKPVEKARSELSILDGDLSFDKFTAQWLGGEFSGNLSFGQSEAAQLVNGQVTFQNADAKQIQSVLGLSDVLRGNLNGHVSLEGAGKNGEELLSGLTGSGLASISGGMIEGLHENALPKILMQADQAKEDNTQLDGKALASFGLFDGEFEFEPVQIPFSITSGSVRANSIHLKNDQLVLNGSLKYEIFNQNFDVNAKIAFQAGREAVIGASPDIQMTFQGSGEKSERLIDASALVSFLGMRRAERREREFETQKSNILEQQRLARLGRQVVLDHKLRVRREEERKAQEEEAKRLEAERLANEKLEAERLENEQLEADRLEAERLKAEKLEAKRLETERLEAERLEAERLAAEERQKQRDAELLKLKNKAKRVAKERERSQKVAPKIIETLKNRVRESILQSQ